MELRNPSLKEIDFLIGEWSVAITNASFLANLGQEIRLPVHYEWKADGAVIASQQKNKTLKGAPESATWIIGRDESGATYTVLYGDSRGVSRVYLMSFERNLWKMWRDSPEFAQRFEGVVSQDKKTITADWHYSRDGGKTWTHDFSMKYERSHRA